MTTESIVSVEKLRALYGPHVAINDLSFTAERARTLALIGPNGAGKSTLFRVLLGLHHPAGGRASIFGQEARALTAATLARLAFVPETHAEEPSLRVEELAEFHAVVHPRFDRSFFDELAASFALRKSARVRELSRGQRAGLVVGLALAQKSELLLLDDPLLGLDPLARRRVIEAILTRTSEGGLTTLIAAHELDDLERVADDVVLIGRKKALSLGSLVDLLEHARLVRVSPATSIETLQALPHVLAVDAKRDATEVVFIATAEPHSVRQIHASIRSFDPNAGESENLSFEALVLAWLSQESRKDLQQ